MKYTLSGKRVCSLLDGRGEILWSQSTRRMNNLHHIYRIMHFEPRSAFLCVSTYYTDLSDPDCFVWSSQNYHEPGALWVICLASYVLCYCRNGSNDVKVEQSDDQVLVVQRCRSDEKNKHFVVRRHGVYKSLFNTLQSCCFPSQQ